MSGPRRSAADLAGAAYDAIRALNHATYPGQCELSDQHDLYLVLANLSALARITPQTLRQSSRWLAREQRAGRVRVAGGEHAGHPADAVANIRDALALAEYWIAHAARSLDEAHQQAAHLATCDRPPAIGT